MIPLSNVPTVELFICSFRSGMLIKATQKFEHFETCQELKSHEKRNMCGNFELS